MSNPNDTLAPSVIFSTLVSRRRRAALRELLDNEQSIPVATLVQRIVAEREDAEPKRVRAQLHHNHLPKLEDAGVVTVEDGNLTLTKRGKTVEPFLVVAERYDATNRSKEKFE